MNRNVVRVNFLNDCMFCFTGVQENCLGNALPRLFPIVGNSFGCFLVCLARVPQIVENAKFWTFVTMDRIMHLHWKCPKLDILYDLWNSRKADQKSTEGVANNYKKSWESISQAVFLNAVEAKHEMQSFKKFTLNTVLFILLILISGSEI